LKQGQYEPLAVERQALIIYAAINGFIDHLPESAVRRYENELYRFVENRHPDLFADIETKKQFDDELKAKTDAVLTEFKEVFTA
ncbi:MAG: F0F1 ATP synthase subunit alpha, partial [Candidatus Binatia bacterium]